jgi:hypothetical protein
MGVNANPRVRVTAVIGDTSKPVHGRWFSRPIRNQMRRETKRKPRKTRGFREAD